MERANGSLPRHNDHESNPESKGNIGRIGLKKLTVEEEYERRLRVQGDGEANVRAIELLNDELDEVKTLKHRLNLMKYQGIRREQIKQKEELKQREKDYGAYWDGVMLKRRDEEIREEVERMKEKKKQQRAYADELTKQVNECKKRQILEEERVAQEGIQIRRQIQRLNQMEMEKERAKKVEQKKRLETLVMANKHNERYKHLRRQEEIEEDKRILAYIAKKEYEQEMILAERERKKREMEMETARLRALQRKTTDKKAEEDARRAKRHQQQREKALDKRIRDQKDAKDAMMREVLQERAKQIALKKQLARVEIEEDKKFMRRIEAEQAAQFEREERLKEAKRRKARLHAQEVIRLDKKREKTEKLERLRQLEEDQRNAMDGDVHEFRVRKVCEKKMREHVESGYPLPPDLVRPKESEEQKAARKAKFYRSRPLW